MPVRHLAPLRVISLAGYADPRRMHVHGTIVGHRQSCSSGTIVVGDGIIKSVHDTRRPANEGGIDIDTGGLIVPALVDAHNHPEYAAFPRWIPSCLFEGRFGWRGQTRCGMTIVTHPDPYFRARVASPLREIARAGGLPDLILYGQVRAVVGGAAAIVVDADVIPALLSSATIIREHIGGGELRALLDPSCLTTDDARELGAFLRGAENRLFVHCAEGLDSFGRREFDTLERCGLVTARTVLVHGLGLGQAHWSRTAASQATLIWSPTSNLTLYGQTLDPRLVLDLGIDVVIGPDWPLTGGSTTLDELVVARKLAPWIDPRVLVGMVTQLPARLVGLNSGVLAPGRAADLLVLRCDPAPRYVEDAAALIVAAGHADVELVLAMGRVVWGTAPMLERILALDENVTVLQVPAGSTSIERVLVFPEARFAALEARLASALAGVGGLAPLWEPQTVGLQLQPDQLK